MSEHLPESEPILSLSKVKLTRNAKAFVQAELTVVEGATDEELTRLRLLATAQMHEIEREFPE